MWKILKQDCLFRHFHLTSIRMFVIALHIFVIAPFLSIACVTNPEISSISGTVIDVHAGSMLKIDSVVLRDDEGNIWLFSADGYSGISASHLRQHMILGERINVRYHRRNKSLTIIDINDIDDSGILIGH